MCLPQTVSNTVAAVWSLTKLAQWKHVLHALAAAVSVSGVVVALGFNRRSHPLCRQARNLIAAGKLGKIRAVLSAFNEPLDEASMPEWKRRRSSKKR